MESVALNITYLGKASVRIHSCKTTRMLRLYVARQFICGEAGCSYPAKG